MDDDILQEFIYETEEELEKLDGTLLSLESDPNNQTLLSEIFRVLHTIKGTCGFFDLPRLEKVAHAGEDVLGLMRDGTLEVTPDIISLILECLDRIKSLFVELKEQKQEPKGNDEDIISRLNSIVTESQKGLEESDDTVNPDINASPNQEPEKNTAHLLKDDIPPSGSDSNDINVSGGNEEENNEGKQSELNAAIKQEDTESYKKPAQKSNSNSGQTIRVKLSLVENLMTMVSELVLTRNQLLQITRDKAGNNFDTPLQRLNQIVSQLQEGVMKTRMQPIGNAWSKVPRLIRDLSKDLGKKIVLEMEGEDTEVDRQMLDLIKDPLTHMIRNSVDHGMETPEERLAAGKPETGVVNLKAYHEGGHIIIQISDDGKGVNAKKVAEKALENGLTTSDKLKQMTDNQICQFIFKPGFSTASSVTSVSGRGVGMDVVRSNIEKIGGNIELTTEQGRGSCFTIKIPLTLAIVPALIVECGSSRFAIPQISVKEMVRISKNGNTAIEYIDGSPVLRLRESLLPLIKLSQILDMGEENGGEERFIVILQVGTYSFGVMVDNVLDIEEIVIKPVSELLKNISVYSGNTILGDGSVIMILDPNGIAHKSNEDGASQKIEQLSVFDSDDNKSSEQTMLLLREGDSTPKAIPLSLVTRLEEFDAAQVEFTNGTPVVQYRNSIMPLMMLSDSRIPGNQGWEKVVVFTRAGESIGLVVDDILDIAKSHSPITPMSSDEKILGTTTISGKITEVIDVSYILNYLNQDWYKEDGEIKRSNINNSVIAIATGNNYYFSIINMHMKSIQCKTIHLQDAINLTSYLSELNKEGDVIIIDDALIENEEDAHFIAMTINNSKIDHTIILSERGMDKFSWSNIIPNNLDIVDKGNARLVASIITQKK